MRVNLFSYKIQVILIESGVIYCMDYSFPINYFCIQIIYAETRKYFRVSELKN